MKAPVSRPVRRKPQRMTLPDVPEHAPRPAAAKTPPPEEPELDETIRKMLEAAYT